MQRKIIKQGKQGNTIFLPIKWIRSHHLKPGDAIEMSEVGNGLLISGKGNTLVKQEKYLSLVSENERFIRIQLQGLYRLGYDKITIENPSSPQKEIIEKIINSILLGFEIVSSNEKFLILENVAEPSLEQAETILQRMFFIIIESFSDNKITSLEKVTKYDNFYRRTITKKHLSEETASFYWSLSTYLNLIARNRIHFISFQENTFSPFLKQEIKLIEPFLKDMRKAFFAEDKLLIAEIQIDAEKHLNKHLLPLLKKGKECAGLYFLAEYTRLINLATSPILAILTNK